MALTILQIDSSAFGDHSFTRKQTAKLVADLLTKNPDAKVIKHDLAAHPLPHISPEVLSAFFTPPEKRDAAMAQAIQLSDQKVDELLTADIIVIGAPMWNFGIPSALKAWIDHICRAGRTFKYAESGPVGLLPHGKKVIIVSSRGGIYSEGVAKPMDHQETYLTAILGFLGLKDIAFIRTEGVAMGEDAVKKALATADTQSAAILKNVA